MTKKRFLSRFSNYSNISSMQRKRKSHFRQYFTQINDDMHSKSQGGTGNFSSKTVLSWKTTIENKRSLLDISSRCWSNMLVKKSMLVNTLLYVDEIQGSDGPFSPVIVLSLPQNLKDRSSSKKVCWWKYQHSVHNSNIKNYALNLSAFIIFDEVTVFR